MVATTVGLADGPEQICYYYLQAPSPIGPAFSGLSPALNIKKKKKEGYIGPDPWRAIFYWRERHDRDLASLSLEKARQAASA